MTIRLHAPKGSEEYCYGCGSYWTGTHSCSEIQSMLDDGYDGLGDVLIVERIVEASDSFLADILEEVVQSFGIARIYRIAGDGGAPSNPYGIDAGADGPASGGQSIYDAVHSLYRKMKEGERGD